ncbi:hypothetical protein AMTR_s00134p00075640 [Amborella trichopoda]|uniref:Uncharacterized protein n=1 Tax=Amborella trichopoda TaxID=13333 RepID=W1P4W6_AMBTC|nr:hypothetical protein AMTR_s00134p00075640 [Amborella trichopoda]
MDPPEVLARALGYEVTLNKGAKKKGTKKKKKVESHEPSATVKPEVRRKSTGLNKKAFSSLDASPSIHSSLNEAADLTPRSKKRAKTKASPSQTLPSTVATPIQETIPKVVITQPGSSGQTSFNLSWRPESVPFAVVEIEASIANDPTAFQIVQSLTISSLRQGDFLGTIPEEGNILEDDTDAIDVALIAPTISEVEPQSRPAETLELMVVSASEMVISMISEAEPHSQPNVPSSEILAVVPQEPAIIAEVPSLVVASSSSLPSSVSRSILKMKAPLAENFLRYSI